MRTSLLASFLLCACGLEGGADALAGTDGGSSTGGAGSSGGADADTGDTGGPDNPPLPEGEFERISGLEIRNDLGVDRIGETAYSAIPIPRAFGLNDLSRLVVSDDEGRWRPAQFTAIARWGGPLSDASLPVRWLAVAVPADVQADTAVTYELRRYDVVPEVDDPRSLSLHDDGSTISIDTDAAIFTLDKERPGLLQRIVLDGAVVFDAEQHGEAGPRLQLEDGTSPSAVLDPDGVEVVESGPVRAVVEMRGHFVGDHPDVVADCAFDGQPYPRFGYTAVLTFTRGSGDIDVQFHLRNECSDAFAEPWTDQAAVVAEAAWVQPLALGTRRYYAFDDAVEEADGEVVVEQRKSEPLGGSQPWAGRSAQVRVNDAVAAETEAVEAPMVAATGEGFVALAQIPWMRYREPQALAVTPSGIELRFVSAPILLGEAKGLWNRAKIQLDREDASLDAMRERGLAELERGLLVRAPLADFNAAGVYTSLGDAGTSTVKERYVATMDQLHADTVGPGGQWERAKTFGAQLWPDIQYDPWTYAEPDAVAAPSQCDGAMNYWNPSGAELLEFFRTGDPKWVWDFSLPQSWLQMFTAYINIGERAHGNRNGFAPTSGGVGEGQWHRAGFGSSDYSYNQGMDEAYVLRPGPVMRDRFGQAGLTAVELYDAPEVERTDANFVEIGRFAGQRYDMLANCAEFSPGPRGQACHDRLAQLMTELAEQNLRPGVLCQPDTLEGDTCWTPQQFMQNSMHYATLVRHVLNYGDALGDIGQAVTRGPSNLYRYGIEQDAAGEIVVDGCFAAGQECDLAPDHTDVLTCRNRADSEGNTCMYAFSKPQTLALLMIAGQLDPSTELCDRAAAALDDPALYVDFEATAATAGGGWWKGSAQMMQSVIFAVGGYDAC